MPWFKEGAHDRIFNSQLNGAVSLTDDSIYLKEQLIDKKNCVFYSLKNIAALPEIVHNLLDHPDQLETIAQNGYKTALSSHSWKKRAETLLFYIQNFL